MNASPWLMLSGGWSDSTLDGMIHDTCGRVPLAVSLKKSCRGTKWPDRLGPYVSAFEMSGFQ